MKKPEVTPEIVMRSIELYYEQAEKEKMAMMRNSGFAQIYRPKGTELLSLIGRTNKMALFVALLVIEAMDQTGMVVTTSADLCEHLMVDRSNLAKAIKVLEDLCFCRRCKLKTRGMVILAINPQIAWASTHNAKNRAMYHAAVFMSSETLEPEGDFLERWARIKVRLDSQKRGTWFNTTMQAEFDAPVGSNVIDVSEVIPPPDRRKYELDPDFASKPTPPPVPKPTAKPRKA